MLAHAQADRKQRALDCVVCAETHARLHGKRRRTIHAALEQHWHGHIPARMFEQLLAAGWMLTTDEVRDIRDWQPQYRQLVHVPFSAYPTDETRQRQQAAVLENEQIAEHNRAEASTAAARRPVLQRLEKLTAYVQHRTGAQCHAKAKRTGERCQRLNASSGCMFDELRLNGIDGVREGAADLAKDVMG